MSSPAQTPTLDQQRERHIASRRLEVQVQNWLRGRKIDVVAFVEELLSIARQTAEVRCRPTGDHELCFEVPGEKPLVVPLDAGRGKLRMICARLAVLSQESGNPFLPYGGEGVIRQNWHVRWDNTPDKQEFAVVGI